MIACCLFDLDGVIVDTARYHYLVCGANPDPRRKGPGAGL